MRSSIAIAGAVVGATQMAACETYRIEYRTRPAYYQRLVDEPLPEREVLDDGTVVIYQTVDLPGQPGAKGTGGDDDDGSPHFRVWDEQDDGSVVVRALLPEHVLVVTLNCLRLDDYEPLWEQMVAERTKQAYAAQGQGVAEFSAFFRENRVDLAKMLNRMRMGIATNETVVEPIGDGRLQCRFWPQTAKLFKFKSVFIARDGAWLKLEMIR